MPASQPHPPTSPPSPPSPPLHPELPAQDEGLLYAVTQGEARLTSAQALELYHSMPLMELGRWADARCRAIHGSQIRTYVIDRNINYTNVCTARCTFCAFRRDGHEDDAYTLTHEQILEKIQALHDIGGTQILMQGGMNPELPLDWYLGLLSTIKQTFPAMHVHAFSPPELIEFVSFFDPPGTDLQAKLHWVLSRLQDAGLDSVPGGGGEIFAQPVRRKIGLGKCDAQAWLTTMFVAHTLGMFTSATMMFGHIEGAADRIHHLSLCREWQDLALAQACRQDVPMGHYKAFISWPFQRDNTPLGRVKDWMSQPEDQGSFPSDVVANLTGDGDPAAHELFGRRLRTSGSTDYLRTQALSRLFLDNFYSIGSSWVTMGPHIGQVGLQFGANDMGSVMMEENVVSAAGTTYCLNEAVLCRLIRDAGFVPAQRDNNYDVLAVHNELTSPDLQVSDWSEHRVQKLLVHTEPEPETLAQLTVGTSD